MKKETIIAIVFGILLGVGGAIVIIVRAKQIGTNKVSVGSAKNVTPAALKNSKIQLLEVTAPATQSISAKDTVTIKGKVSKNALIVVQSPIKEVALKTDKESFSVDFPLALGENVISITAYPSETQIPPQTKQLKLYYLEEE